MSAVLTKEGTPRFQTLIWLMPAAFAPHILEEYGTGFPGWVSTTLGGVMTNQAFLINNAVFMAILVSLTLWASLRPGAASAFILLSWASGNQFWNFVFHLTTTALYDRFSPGLLTAVLLYFPVSVAVAWTTLKQKVLSPVAFTLAASIGAALMGVVIWVGLFHPPH
jgi:hypothetical protein